MVTLVQFKGGEVLFGIGFTIEVASHEMYSLISNMYAC